MPNKRRLLTDKPLLDEAAVEMTPAKWKQFLHLIANGTTRSSAVKQIGVTGKTMQLFLALEPGAVEQYREAQLTWKRRDTPFELVEQILMKLAMGQTFMQACASHGRDFQDILWLVLKDPSLKEMYDDARLLSVELMADETLQIADASQDDRDENGKADHELINRDRLRCDIRWRTMAARNPAVFSPKMQKDIKKEITVNAIETLDGARKRKEAAFERAKELRVQASEKTVH